MTAAFHTVTRYEHGLSPDDPIKVDHYVQTKRTTRASLPDTHYETHLGVLTKGLYGINYPTYSGTLTPGGIWFTGVWEPHYGEGLDVPLEMVVFTAQPDHIGDLGPLGGEEWRLPFFLPPASRPNPLAHDRGDDVLRLAAEMKDALRDDRLDRESLRRRVWLKFHELLAIALEITRRDSVDPVGQARAFRVLQPAIRLVRSMTGRPPSLDEAARSCGLGRSRFCQLFKDVMGATFGRFALDARLGAAVADLRGGSLTIKEVAGNRGFHDASHLHREIRNRLGRRPSELRTR